MRKRFGVAVSRKPITDGAKSAFIWVLIVGVMLVLFSPLTQLEPTALRAVRMAPSTMMSIAMPAAVAAASVLIAAFHFSAAQDQFAFRIPIIDLECARLC